MNYKDVIYEHLGHSNFNKKKFVPISNREGWIKPNGGLWASPENTTENWENWIHMNEFMLDKYSCKFRFKLEDNTRLLIINNADQLTDDLLVKEESELSCILNMKLIDFEKIEHIYDAMLVLISEDNRLYWDLYGWDCDSLLVFNPNVIKEL